ncbi:hypothetical protein OG474_25675 [Kribbella sp. NBC_01505]|uniref:hypothetical protein n=1 Tax=Kribbella sp. NBC_01505 TaxID=2903580 RepID=UPI00386640AF
MAEVRDSRYPVDLGYSATKIHRITVAVVSASLSDRAYDTAAAPDVLVAAVGEVWLTT